MTSREPDRETEPRRARPNRDVGLAVICVLMTAASVLAFLAGRTAYDQMMGGAGAVLFGVIGGAPVARLARRNPDRPGPRLGPYLPLAAAVAEIPWVIVMLLGLLVVVGDKPFEATDASERSFGTLAALPAAAGIVTGIIAIAGRWAHGPVEWVCLLIGWVACGAIAWALASGVLS